MHLESRQSHNDGPAGSGELVAEASLNAIFDATSPRAAHEVCGLLVHLVKEGAVPVHSLLDLITSSAEQLEDLRYADCPAEPQLCMLATMPLLACGGQQVGSGMQLLLRRAWLRRAEQARCGSQTCERASASWAACLG